jgi:hypothetical protein
LTSTFTPSLSTCTSIGLRTLALTSSLTPNFSTRAGIDLRALTGAVVAIPNPRHCAYKSVSTNTRAYLVIPFELRIAQRCLPTPTDTADGIPVHYGSRTVTRYVATERHTFAQTLVPSISKSTGNLLTDIAATAIGQAHLRSHRTATPLTLATATAPTEKLASWAAPLLGTHAATQRVGLPPHQRARTLVGAGTFTRTGASVVLRNSQLLAGVTTCLVCHQTEGERTGRGTTVVGNHHRQLVAAASQLRSPESDRVVDRVGLGPLKDYLAVEVDNTDAGSGEGEPHFVLGTVCLEGQIVRSPGARRVD